MQPNPKSCICTIFFILTVIFRKKNLVREIQLKIKNVVNGQLAGGMLPEGDLFCPDNSSNSFQDWRFIILQINFTNNRNVHITSMLIFDYLCKKHPLTDRHLFPVIFYIWYPPLRIIYPEVFKKIQFFILQVSFMQIRNVHFTSILIFDTFQ